jgi:uncharacterized protein involved in exopolysaccharide biosynthesis
MTIEEVLWRIIARWRLYLALVPLAFILAGLLALPLLDKGYKAEAAVQLREEENRSQLGGLLSSLAPSDGYNALDAALSSRVLAARLAARPEVMDALNAASWKPSAAKRFADWAETRLFGLPTAGGADMTETLRAMLRRSLTVARLSPSSSVVRLEFAAPRQEAARLVLDAILLEADVVLRQSKITAYEERLQRVTAMLEEAAPESARKSLLDLHSRLLTNLVGARSLAPFAFVIVDQPMASGVRSRPSFLLAWGGLMVIGMALATAFALAAPRSRRR